MHPNHSTASRRLLYTNKISFTSPKTFILGIKFNTIRLLKTSHSIDKFNQQKKKF